MQGQIDTNPPPGKQHSTMPPIPFFLNPSRRLVIQAGLATTLLPGCGGGGSLAPDLPVRDRRVPVASGVALQVRDWNAGAARLHFVLLAGLGGNARCFDSLAPALAERMDARVIAVSRRGYGLSDKPLPSATGQGYEPATLVADLRAVLDALAIDRAVMLGHSIAGNELTLFAGQHPQRTRGLVYLDTTYDYSRDDDTTDPEITLPDNPALHEPEPSAADLASLDAAMAFGRRTSKHWSPPLQAQMREALAVQPDGSVASNTPPAVAQAMVASANAFTPDYRAVRAPALVVAAYPGTQRDLFPWLSEPLADARTRADAQTLLAVLRNARAADEARLTRALPGSRLLRLHDANHADCFIEHEAAVLQALEGMRW